MTVDTTSENNSSETHRPSRWRWGTRLVWQVVVFVVGMVVTLAGIAMIVLPGPAFIVLPLGLAILATEFVWADKLKQKVMGYFREAREKWRKRKAARSDS